MSRSLAKRRLARSASARFSKGLKNGLRADSVAATVSAGDISLYITV
jgi:hypothetical protein